jgi:hypothetical protein
MSDATSDDDALRGYRLGRLADDRVFWEHLCLVEEELIVRLRGVSPGKDPVPLGRYDFRVPRPWRPRPGYFGSRCQTASRPFEYAVLQEYQALESP